MWLPRLSSAAEHRNAADDGSPGTWMSHAFICAGPVTEATRVPAVVGTPKSGSMSSVWLRDGAGSFSTVLPSAYTPASKTAVLSWADAIGAS